MAKTALDDCLTLSITSFWRGERIGRDIFASGTIEWRSRKEKSCLSFESHYGEFIELRYAANHSPVVQNIKLAWTVCHYGNARPWFVCPSCECRRLSLHFASNAFECRRCHGHYYATQLNKMSLHGGMGYQKLVNRLEFDEDNAYGRPKGMHQTTYERILDRISECDEAAAYKLLNKKPRKAAKNKATNSANGCDWWLAGW